MGEPLSDSSGRTMETNALAAHSVRRRRSDSRSSADETVGDRGGTFKPAAGAEGGYRRPSARNQGAAGGAGTLDRYSFDLTNELVERNRAAPMEHLARKLLGARTRAFERHQQPGFHLRLCARDFRLIDGLGRAIDLSHHDAHQLRDVGGIGAGIEAEHPSV